MYKFYIYHPDLGKPIKLKYDPDGWNTSGKTRKRDANWHGVFFEYSPRLRFVKDGRDIIAFFYERYGPDANLLLIITRLSKKTRRYRTDYTGRFNLMKLKITPLYAECNIEQTGFLQKFKNRQDVKVDLLSLVTQGGKAIEANENETVDVELHSKVLRKRFDGSLGDNFYASGAIASNLYWQIVPEDIAIDEIVERFELGGSSHNTTVPVNMFTITEDGEYTFDLRFEVSVYLRVFPNYPSSCDATADHITELGSDSRMTFYIKKNNDAPIAFTKTDIIGTPVGGLVAFDSSVFTYNGILTLVKDDTITIYGDQDVWTTVSINGKSLIFWGANQPTTFSKPVKVGCAFSGFTTETVDFGGAPSGASKPAYIKVQAVTVFPASTSPMILKHEAFARVVESITDEKDSFRSEYYGRTDSEPTAYDADGEGSLRGILPGKLVRGFPITTNHIYASFKDLVATCKAIDGVGVGLVSTGVKQRIHVEPLSYFFNPTRVVQFSYVKDIEKEVADEYYFNELEAGYEKWNNEFSNNLDEFCTKMEYTFPVVQVKNRMVLKSPYIASGYTIEYVRRDRYIDNSTKDNDRDNDNFVIQLRRSDGSLVTDKDEDFAELNNILSPQTVYNAKLSVMRNIRRNGGLVRTPCYHKDDEFISLAFGEGNTTFTSRLTTETEVVNEKSIQVKKLSKSLWIPEYYTFKVKPTEDESDALDANPYGIIEFSSSKTDFKKGWLIETRPDDDSDLTQFKVLRANV